MIQGVVNAAYEPVISLAFQGPTGRSPKIAAIVDTGFSEFLTLPPELVNELGLPLVSTASLTLADGSKAGFDMYVATVLWDGRPRQVYAHMSDTVPLVGMRLLDRHSLFIEVEDGGSVLIQATQ